MVNFGGDIRAVSSPTETTPWIVGIEGVNKDRRAAGRLELVHGAVTTSGSSYRHCFVNGRKMCHILNPRTGWPVEEAPHSVTVAADLCTEAGLLSTLAMLQGADAEEFLESQSVRFHCIR
jgi:thiamine biosynthesis lipoprotein